MQSRSQPAIWLIILIVGLAQLSESVYSPSLPDIANALQAPESSVEYTLTIYLLGFAIGTLFWGKISDRFGRKPFMIIGLIIFILGSLGCYSAKSIEVLLLSRFIQAFGGSTGSVLGQAICRDAFHGPTLGKIYSSIGSALALFPAIGPIIGGFIAEHFGWTNIFLFLVLFASLLTGCVATCLPETHPKSKRQAISIWMLIARMAKDKKVIAFGCIVAGCNGVLFSYFAEGSFYLINGLNLSPSQYGLSFLMIAFSSMLGGFVSKKAHSRFSSEQIMRFGLWIIAGASGVFSIFAWLHHSLLPLSTWAMISIALSSQMANAFGICMTISTSLALALVDYKYAIGSASSLFGFFYYCLISLFTLGMGMLHNGTLLPMPFYFLGIAIFMIIVQRSYLKKQNCV